MDSRFLRASTAAAACASQPRRHKRGSRPTVARGGFTVSGRRLLPLSAHHFGILEELQSPLIFGGVAGPLDLVLISRVCGSERPTVALDATDQAFSEEFDRVEAKFPAELTTVKAWLNLVYFPQPAQLDLTEQESNADKIVTVRSHLPGALWIVQAILRETRGHTFDELYYRTPYAWLRWLYEAMREQRDEMPWITPRGEPEADATPDEEAIAAAEQTRLDTEAGQVERYCHQLWAKAQGDFRARGGVEGKEYLAAERRIWDVEFPRLLGKSAAGLLVIEEVQL